MVGAVVDLNIYGKDCGSGWMHQAVPVDNDRFTVCQKSD